MDTKGIISMGRRTMGVRRLDNTSHHCFNCGQEEAVLKLNLDGIWFEWCDDCRKHVVELLEWAEPEPRVCKNHSSRQPDCIPCDMV